MVVKMLETVRTAKFLLYMVIITVILDEITTLYALRIGLNEGNIITFKFIQNFGIYVGLTIVNIGKIIAFTLGYLFIKNFSSSLLINNKKNWAFLSNGFLYLILLIIFINTLLVVINNVSLIWQKMNTV